jgi:hypothetical protein
MKENWVFHDWYLAIKALTLKDKDYHSALEATIATITITRLAMQ